jgi:hypothetical protein
MRIVVEGDTVQKLVQNLDGKEKYVSTLVSILEDVGWVEQEPSGKYIITDKGNSGCCINIPKAVFASSFRSFSVTVPHTFVSKV